MLVYLGHIEPFYETVTPKINNRILSIYKPSKSVVFNCFIIGESGVGKTSFLNMFIKQKFENNEINIGGTEINSVVASINSGGKDRYLVLNKVNVDKLDELLEDERRLQYCD